MLWFNTSFRPAAILRPADRALSIQILGSPGTGKTLGMLSMAWQDILAGSGVCVIDPTGNLANILERRIALRPDLAKRTVIIDANDNDWVVPINPLHSMRGGSATRLALFMTDVVVRLWRVDPTSAPRMVWLLTNSFLALSALNLTLADLPKLLLHADTRRTLMARLPAELRQVKDYFDFEFPQSYGGAKQWALPVLNKLGGLLFDADIRALVSSEPSLDFRRVMDERLIVLGYVEKGKLGEDMSSLLAAFIVAMFQKAALSRTDTQTRDGERPLYFLYLDEFQNYTTQNINDILAESRQFGLSLVIAHQYLDQLEPEVQSAVLATVGTSMVFRVSARDAGILSPEIFPSRDFGLVETPEWGMQRQGIFNQIATRTIRPQDGWDRMAQLLVNQPARYFWLRRKGASRPVHLRTPDVQPIRMTPDLAAAMAALRRQSGEGFGIAKAQALVEMEGRRLAHGERQTSSGKSTPDQAQRKRGRPKGSKNKAKSE